MSVSRRAFALGIGAVPLLPRGVPAAQDNHPPENPVASTPELATPAPKFFDAHELATVAEIAELIIPTTDTPGAREAHVAEYLDRILSDSPEPAQTAFLEGLWWTDGFCQRSEGSPFKDLPNQKQLRILTELHDSSHHHLATGHAFIRTMKIWTAKIYYSTEIGRHELNKGGRVPATYSGNCAT